MRACIYARLLLRQGGVRTDDDDRERTGKVRVLQTDQDIIARHIREVRFQKDQVGLGLDGKLQTGAAVCGGQQRDGRVLRQDELDQASAAASAP